MEQNSAVSVSSFSTYHPNVFTPILFLSEGRAGIAWVPSNKMLFFALRYKAPLAFPQTFSLYLYSYTILSDFGFKGWSSYDTPETTFNTTWGHEPLETQSNLWVTSHARFIYITWHSKKIHATGAIPCRVQFGRQRSSGPSPCDTMRLQDTVTCHIPSNRWSILPLRHVASSGNCLSRSLSSETLRRAVWYLLTDSSHFRGSCVSYDDRRRCDHTAQNHLHTRRPWEREI
jgi:hypothetical protein